MVNEMGGAFRGNSYHLLQKCAVTSLLLLLLLHTCRAVPRAFFGAQIAESVKDATEFLEASL